MKRLKKEYHLDINKYIDIKYGSMDKNNPKVIYVYCKSWITPKKRGSYVEFFNRLMGELRTEIRKNVIASNKFDNKFIFDYSINAASLRENQKKFLTFEFYFKQKNNLMDKLKDINIENMFKDTFDNLANNLIEYTFELSKSKH